MTEKMRTQASPYQANPRSRTFLSEAAKDLLFASGCVAALAMLGYSLVNVVLTNTRDPSQLDIESVIAYILVILGYLLVPGVGVLLVRRKRFLAQNRALLMAETDIADWQFTDAFGGKTWLNSGFFGRRQVIRDIEKVTKCVTWGAADDKEVQCSVCLNDVEQDSEVRILPCKHIFHKSCADLWLVNGLKNSCPMCMQRVCGDRGPDMIPVKR